MSWHAKVKWGYDIESAEGKENIGEITRYLRGRNYTDEAIAGIVGNMAAESGLNPWRWESEEVDYRYGYGLFQYTPASSYINGGFTNPYFAPNTSTDVIVPGAFAHDGLSQLIVFADDSLLKWVGYCWRSYWSIGDYPELYMLSQTILSRYGTDGYLSQTQFSQITNIQHATFAFLACFEGPSVPNLSPRLTDANRAYTIIHGTAKKLPLWLYFKMKERYK